MIVLSGANIQFGGPLQIFKDVLTHLNSKYPDKKVIAIISNANLFPKFDNVKYIEIPLYKKIIILKFFYEYVWYYFLSKRLSPYLWLSLNDCSPTVKAQVRAVYCHNATPFYQRTIKDFQNPNSAFFQSFYYEWFYKINIRKNDYVIVQQAWLKKYFENRFKVKKNRIIVNPFSTLSAIPSQAITQLNVATKTHFNFIYPTKALSYKNLEVILEAARAITQITKSFKIFITIAGTENRYAKQLFSKYGDIESVVWLGTLTRDELEKYYAMSDCLLFPSKLETWGLPISEFKGYKRPIIAADLAYARETMGDYPYAKFFNPDCSVQLKNLMFKLINNEKVCFDTNEVLLVEQPVAANWRELFQILLTK